MKSKTLQSGIFGGMLAVASIAPTWAELPSLEEKPWYGYFAGIAGKRANIGLDTDGGAVIIPLKKDKEPVASNLFINVLYQVEEVAADGKVTVKKIDVDSLTSTTPATAKPDKIVFKGKAEGDVEFEGYFENVRGMVMMGGKILGKGTVTNPLRFTISTKFPPNYANAQDKTSKEFKKKVEDDRLDLKLLDGKRAKVTGLDPFDAALPESGSAGLSQVELFISEYGEGKFTFTAAPGSKLTIVQTSKGQAFSSGMLLNWEADAEGKARLAVDVK
jgi:hypothetical protein